MKNIFKPCKGADNGLSDEERKQLKAEQKAAKRQKLDKRITELDLLRGIAILAMVADHVFYDLGYLMCELFSGYNSQLEVVKVARFYWMHDAREIIRYFFLFIFFALVGVSCSFSKSNIKRGLKLMAVALVVTLATYIIGKVIDDRDMTIVFGVLHCMALTIILISLLELLTRKFKYEKWLYLIIGVIMVAVGAYLEFVNPGDNIQGKKYGSEPFITILLGAMFGLNTCGSDCFQLLFYGGQIFIGVFLGKILYPERRSLLFKNGYKNNFVTFSGRHSLIIYVAHQVIIPVIIGLILLIVGFKLR